MRFFPLPSLLSSVALTGCRLWFMQCSYKYMLKACSNHSPACSSPDTSCSEGLSLFLRNIFTILILQDWCVPALYLPKELNRAQNTGCPREPVCCDIQPALNLLLQLAPVRLHHPRCATPTDTPPPIPRATSKPGFVTCPTVAFSFFAVLRTNLSLVAADTTFASLNLGPEENSARAAAQRAKGSRTAFCSAEGSRNAARVVLTSPLMRHHQSAIDEARPLW